MSRSPLYHVLLSSLLMSTLSLNAQANVIVGISVAMPITPPVGIVIAPPPDGFTECYTVTAEWFQGMYYPAHRECVYASGVIYSPGYWGYADGAWMWMGGHWGGVHGHYAHGYRNGYVGRGYVGHGYEGHGYERHGYVEHGYVEHGNARPSHEEGFRHEGSGGRGRRG